VLFGALTGTAAWGGTLHFYLFLAGLCLAVGPAIQISAGLFAEERRQRTLELLYLTGMGSVELFVGKLLGGALVSSCELMALAPFVAVPFLSGGLSFDLFTATLACLPTVFVLVLAIGSLASALCRQEGAALVVSGVLIGASCLALPVPYNLGLWLTGTVPFDRSWLILSPALGPWMVAKNFGRFSVGEFWFWTAVMWGWSTACLLFAALLLKRNWRRDLEGTIAEGWAARWEGFVLGSSAWRIALRRRVLGINAYQWLAQQDRRPVLQAQGFIATVCAFWLLGWCAWPRLWPSPLNFYTVAIVLLTGTDLLVSYAAARRMAADRQEGSLELLLTTSLSPEDMLAGQKAALNQQFAPVRRGLFSLLVLIVLAGLLTRSWTTPGIVSYLVVWCFFFAWWGRSAGRSAPLAMWVAVNCGRPMYGAFRTGGAWNRAWAVYWFGTMATNLGVFGGRARSFPRGSTMEMLVTSAVVFWALLFMVATRKSSNALAESLVLEMRSIAQEPLPERNDPRFKEWKDVRTRFPAPPGGGFGDPGRLVSQFKPVNAAGAWFWRPVGRVCGLAWRRLRNAATNR
jgi:ABC-type Na+ efflux pump permease subunit